MTDSSPLPAGPFSVEEADKPRIARQVRRGRFDQPTERDRVQHDAVRAAARFVGEHPERRR